ncbi:MAG TPA: hypothetical protein VNO70_01050 [Blastocatellia bacterium]|nr:hypothetical protein [Blastocatellia bacterium]
MIQVREAEFMNSEARNGNVFVVETGASALLAAKKVAKMEIMSSDDKTQILGEDGKLDTKPMLEAILDRLNALTQDVKEMRMEIADMRAEMEKSFQKVHKRLDILSATVNQVQADQQILEDRVSKLEQKPS